MNGQLQSTHMLIRKMVENYLEILPQEWSIVIIPNNIVMSGLADSTVDRNNEDEADNQTEKKIIFLQYL